MREAPVLWVLKSPPKITPWGEMRLTSTPMALQHSSFAPMFPSGPKEAIYIQHIAPPPPE